MVMLRVRVTTSSAPDTTMMTMMEYGGHVLATVGRVLTVIVELQVEGSDLLTVDPGTTSPSYETAIMVSMLSTASASVANRE